MATRRYSRLSEHLFRARVWYLSRTARARSVRFRKRTTMSSHCFSRRAGLECRTGLATLEAVLILAVTFPVAMVGFWMARLALSNLYQVISTYVGSPYF